MINCCIPKASGCELLCVVSLRIFNESGVQEAGVTKSLEIVGGLVRDLVTLLAGCSNKKNNSSPVFLEGTEKKNHVIVKTIT